jgi:hypothetical protein
LWHHQAFYHHFFPCIKYSLCQVHQLYLIAEVITKDYCGNELTYNRPFAKKQQHNYINWSEAEKDRIKKWLIWFKKRLMFDGFLCFDDAYFLSECYLRSIPQVITWIQKRFQYVFVDEMQDMEKHQHDLLEKIFYDQGRSNSRYQRIGDKNQAIFNNEIRLEKIWTKREVSLSLNNSYRLSKPVADLVKYFALERCERFGINGLNSSQIKPHIILYEDGTIENVIYKYSEIAKRLIEDGLLAVSLENPIKAIAWNATWPEKNKEKNNGKVRLENYYKYFRKEYQSQKTDHLCLTEYIYYYDKSISDLHAIRSNLINAFQ